MSGVVREETLELFWPLWLEASVSWLVWGRLQLWLRIWMVHVQRRSLPPVRPLWSWTARWVRRCTVDLDVFLTPGVAARPPSPQSLQVSVLPALGVPCKSRFGASGVPQAPTAQGSSAFFPHMSAPVPNSGALRPRSSLSWRASLPQMIPWVR